MPQIVTREEEKEAIEPIESVIPTRKLDKRYTSMILSKEDKANILDFKVTYMKDNKVRRISNAELFIKLIEYYNEREHKSK